MGDGVGCACESPALVLLLEDLVDRANRWVEVILMCRFIHPNSTNTNNNKPSTLMSNSFALDIRHFVIDAIEAFGDLSQYVSFILT